MSLTKCELRDGNLILYIENDKALLFNHRNFSLYSLSAISAALVLLIDQGLAQKDLINTLAQKSGLATKDLIPHYQEVVRILSIHPTSLTYSDGQYPELKALNSDHLGYPVANTNNTFQVANASFSLHGPSDLLKDLTILLAPIKQPLNKVDFVLEILHEQGIYHIYSNGLLVEQCEQYKEVIPLIIDRLQILAFQKSDYRFCFHGAALRYSTLTLLLPGESGAGKSTLSALLTDAEHQLFSDEYIVFQDNFDPNVIPLPIAVKSGSWQVVTAKYPELATAKTWQRLDGRQLKYQWPTSFADFTPQGPTKTLLIHPQYSQQASNAQVTQMGVIDTLTLLTASGYQLGFELSPEKLEELIGFIKQTKNLRITYSDSEQIVKILRAFK